MSADLTPGSEAWAKRVSPSKAAPILGASPFDSPRAMWLKMRGLVPWDEENEAMERGNLCESAVLAWWRKHHEHDDWREQVTQTLGDWCVATPDALCTHNGEPVLIEAKTTGSQMDEWGTPGTDEVPLHILCQVYMSMEVCHLNGIPVTCAHVPVLGGYRNLFSNYVVRYSAEHGASVLARCRAFYDSLNADEPPPLDSSVATYDAVRRVHPEIDTKAEVALTEPVARELLTARIDLDAAEARNRLAKSTVLDAMGRANFAMCNGIKVARRQGDGPERTKFVALPKNLPLLTIEEAS